MLYGVKYGGINNALMQVGVLDVYFDWFATPALAIMSIVAVEVWQNTSFMMIVLSAGLLAIPQELYEAGEVDGASSWQRFRYITLPLLKFTMVVALLIRMIDLTKIFGLIYLLTFGGPAGSTQTVAFSIYLSGFQDFRISHASTLSYVIVGGVYSHLGFPKGLALQGGGGSMIGLSKYRLQRQISMLLVKGREPARCRLHHDILPQHAISIMPHIGRPGAHYSHPLIR